MLRLLILFALWFPTEAICQKLTFCEKVDAAGHPQNQSDRFSISKKGGFIQVLVHCNKSVGSKFVVIDVYSLKDGKEAFENSIRMNVNPLNTWFFKELTFYKEGDFVVYVYDERDQMLAVGKLRTFFK